MSPAVEVGVQARYVAPASRQDDGVGHDVTTPVGGEVAVLPTVARACLRLSLGVEGYRDVLEPIGLTPPPPDAALGLRAEPRAAFRVATAPDPTVASVDLGVGLVVTALRGEVTALPSLSARPAVTWGQGRIRLQVGTELRWTSDGPLGATGVGGWLGLSRHPTAGP